MKKKNKEIPETFVMDDGGILLARMDITENTDCSNFPADYFPLFSDLLETLQSKDRESMDALKQRDMRTAELYLRNVGL